MNNLICINSNRNNSLAAKIQFSSGSHRLETKVKTNKSTRAWANWEVQISSCDMRMKENIIEISEEVREKEEKYMSWKRIIYLSIVLYGTVRWKVFECASICVCASVIFILCSCDFTNEWNNLIELNVKCAQKFFRLFWISLSLSYSLCTD